MIIDDACLSAKSRICGLIQVSGVSSIKRITAAIGSQNGWHRYQAMFQGDCVPSGNILAVVVGAKVLAHVVFHVRVVREAGHQKTECRRADSRRCGTVAEFVLRAGASFRA